MNKGYGIVKGGVMVFKVLAWLSLVVQVAVGCILLFGGGPAVPIGGLEVPARVVGILNCVAGAIYFFLMLLTANVLTLLLDIRDRLDKGAA